MILPPTIWPVRFFNKHFPERSLNIFTHVHLSPTAWGFTYTQPISHPHGTPMSLLEHVHCVHRMSWGLLTGRRVPPPPVRTQSLRRHPLWLYAPTTSAPPGFLCSQAASIAGKSVLSQIRAVEWRHSALCWPNLPVSRNVQFYSSGEILILSEYSGLWHLDL
jgi:hypothetical protein